MKVLSPQGKCGLRRVSQLLEDHGNWDTALVGHYFRPIDADLILKIKTSRRLEEDVLAWQLEKSGQFSVRSAYRLAFNQCPEQCAFAAPSNRPEGSDECWRKI
jgi:hypothetical protein